MQSIFFTLETFESYSFIAPPLQIYTGCSDGSVQAVKLNLTKNHHCWVKNAFSFWVPLCHFCVTWSPCVMTSCHVCFRRLLVAELFSDLWVRGPSPAAPHWRSHQHPYGFGQMSMERLQLIFRDAAAGQEGDVWHLVMFTLWSKYYTLNVFVKLKLWVFRWQQQGQNFCLAQVNFAQLKPVARTPFSASFQLNISYSNWEVSSKC